MICIFDVQYKQIVADVMSVLYLKVFLRTSWIMSTKI